MIEKKQVQHIATLARLKLTDEEVLVYQKDLSEVLDYFDILQSVNTENIEPMIHSIVQENVAREDIGVQDEPEITMAIMKLAPFVTDGFLKVKTILSFK